MTSAPNDRALLLAAGMENGKWYRVLYMPGAARIPRVFQGQYLGAEAGGLLAFSLRPQAGTSSIAVDQLLDVHPAAKPVPQLPRKAAREERGGRLQASPGQAR